MVDQPFLSFNPLFILELFDKCFSKIFIDACFFFQIQSLSSSSTAKNVVSPNCLLFYLVLKRQTKYSQLVPCYYYIILPNILCWLQKYKYLLVIIYVQTIVQEMTSHYTNSWNLLQKLKNVALLKKNLHGDIKKFLKIGEEWETPKSPGRIHNITITSSTKYVGLQGMGRRLGWFWASTLNVLIKI